MSRSVRCIFIQELHTFNAINVNWEKRTPIFGIVLFRQMQYIVKCGLIILRHDFGAANVEQRRARHPGSSIIVNTIHI